LQPSAAQADSAPASSGPDGSGSGGGPSAGAAAAAHGSGIASAGPNFTSLLRGWQNGTAPSATSGSAGLDASGAGFSGGSLPAPPGSVAGRPAPGQSAAGGPTSGRGDAGSAGGAGDAEGAAAPAAVAAVQPDAGVPAVHKRKPVSGQDGEAPPVPLDSVDTNSGQAVAFTGKMAIDADGAGDAWRHDQTGQSQTSLRYPDGSSLNPTQIPFIVLPTNYRSYIPDASLGDYAAVSYNGKTVYAIFGDMGPKNKFGEASMCAAASLGINPNPNHGGADDGVQYLILPGSKDAVTPSDAQTIQQKGRDLFQKAGIQVQ
jgi:hypothetical protein